MTVSATCVLCTAARPLTLGHDSINRAGRSQYSLYYCDSLVKPITCLTPTTPWNKLQTTGLTLLLNITQTFPSCSSPSRHGGQPSPSSSSSTTTTTSSSWRTTTTPHHRGKGHVLATEIDWENHSLIIAASITVALYVPLLCWIRTGRRMFTALCQYHSCSICPVAVLGTDQAQYVHGRAGSVASGELKLSHWQSGRSED
ncbi:hypothetical protein ElyMa_001352000 [Elysia marginata]|uniref:4Fe-4S ferredoxin-type domain-containing protein n=1 Tax=Elysia marginata TaxID=1093978 RepID=A0AAV4IM58_9GAST|nr:hypothetical protein ElyMa_001352000 [Elysia marginata]